MPRSFDGKGRFGGRIAIGLGVLCLALGCAGPKSAKAPSYPAKIGQETAVRAGTQALADFRREHVLAVSENRAPDYARARSALAQCVGALQPTKETLGMPEYERPALCFETALAAMDRIIAADRRQDRRAEAVGWEMFDGSVASLLLALDPHAAAPGATAAAR